MAKDQAHPPGVEPLAQVVRDVMDARGYNQAELAKWTGLKPQHIEQIVNRTKPYGRAPRVDTQEALARIPGLSIEAIAEAVLRSTGQPLPPARPEGAEMSVKRRSLHSIVDKLPDDELDRAMDLLITLLPRRQ
jgi:transcriptional regulator with XRE-family HTH domain